MSDRTQALLGLEITKLGDIDDDASPWRMTVDAVDTSGRVFRYQVTGAHYNGWPEGPPQRTVEEMADVLVGSEEERRSKAERLNALDREAAAKIGPVMEWLFREQVRVLYGDEGLALLDR